MLHRKILGTPLILGAFILTVASCKKDDAPATPPVYTVPDTYNFENVEYAEATGSISMWAGFTSWLGKSTGRQLSADSANYLWNNTNSAFTAETTTNLPLATTAINALGFGLNSKATDAATFKQLADSMVKVSASFNATAAPGTAGKVGTRLVNYSGVEFNQLVAKGLMGALQIAKINALLDQSQKDDNNTVKAGTGTAMQHNWDLAFGYVGIPKDYDSAKTYANTEANRPLAIGGYFRERGRVIQAGGTIFTAFRKGRAAINAKDYTGRDQAITTIKEMLEKTVAAAAYAYATLPQGSSDLAVKFHAYSECYGFVLALKYRPATSKLTAANYQVLLDIMKTNFYDLSADATNAKLKQMQTILTNTYGTLQ
ncbi:DUF4856 domain-containing protein [Chitinophaga sp. sic0106]|uniref:DUF4856 domain-containing protein n=1 Tax=Chitinophaga sp. sic0106 TaxID=2854785 RepID=UPI001C4781D3|nr:DUF4856 domain-containing protein [Chitinophaga sp. sic0106]MBV7530877.1 DUF4856 domain-containing protein [Chitinophaga sp. sic0106]